MRSLILSSLVVASAFSFAAAAGAASPKMHRASIMVRHVGGKIDHYEAMMGGKMYVMVPMHTWDSLLQDCKAGQTC